MGKKNSTQKIRHIHQIDRHLTRDEGGSKISNAIKEGGNKMRATKSKSKRDNYV